MVKTKKITKLKNIKVCMKNTHMILLGLHAGIKSWNTVYMTISLRWLTQI